jgi:hypothetical protein
MVLSRRFWVSDIQTSCAGDAGRSVSFAEIADVLPARAMQLPQM